MFFVRLLGIVFLSFVEFQESSEAAQWEMKGELGQQLLYNDNIAFGLRDEQPVFGYILAPSLEATRKGGGLEVGVEGQGDIRRYDDSQWDCDNYKLATDNAYRTNRSNFRLSGNFSSTCSYVQQLTDTGLTVPNVQAETYGFAPSWRWQWTARSQLIAEASYSKTSFSSAGATTGSVGFSDNEQYTLRLGGDYVWSRQLSLNGGLFYSNIQYTGPSASTQDLYGAQLGANYLLTREWTVSLGGGPRWIDTQQPQGAAGEGRSSMDMGSVANISLTYDDRLTRFSTGFSDSISPSGIGQVLQTDSLFLNYSYQFARHVSFDLSGNVSRSQDVGGQAANAFDRDYLTASAYIAWEFEKDWQLKGGYLYKWQQFKQDQTASSLIAENSDSNSVMIFLNYAWSGIQTSR